MKIIEVKNMFNLPIITEDDKYAYKDIKIILAQKVNDKLKLLAEFQFILKPILSMKMIMHKFYAITRLSFHPSRLEFMRLLENDM